MRRLSPMIVVLLLAACGGGEAETATTTALEPTTTAAETTTTAAPTTTTTEATTTTTTTVPQPSAEDCLVGTWELDSEAFVDSLMATMGTDLPGEITSGGGSYIVEMDADGSITSTRDEWRYLIESTEGTLAVQLDGTETGTYTTDGDTITISITGGETSVTTGLLVDGELQELPFGPTQTFDAEPLEGAGTFDCAADTLTMTIQTEGPNDGTLEFQSVFLRR